MTKLRQAGLRGARIGVLRQSLRLQDGVDPRVAASFETAIADLRRAGAQIVDDFTVPGFENFPRPPQTAARSKADWESFFAYEGPKFPVRTVAELRDAPSGKAVHPLHVARVAEIAAITKTPEEDPTTIQGRQDEQMYRDSFGAAMDAARVDALVFPVWTFPPRINGDRGQTPQGELNVYRLGHAMACCRSADGFRRRKSAHWFSVSWTSVDRRAVDPICIRI